VSRARRRVRGGNEPTGPTIGLLYGFSNERHRGDIGSKRESFLAGSQWLADALLGSPIPPPHWLDPRHGGTGWVSPYGGYWSARHHVPAGRVRAELGELHSCVNPPVIQGWAWILAIVGIVVALLGFRTLRVDGSGSAAGLAMVMLPMPLWFAAELIAAFFSFDIELRDGVLTVRRWTDVWLGLTGRVVGTRETVHAALSCGSHLQLEGDVGSHIVGMEMWPSSSRLALEERLEDWDIELEFPGRHHVHHPAHWHHGKHRVGHRIPVQTPRR